MYIMYTVVERLPTALCLIIVLQIPNLSGLTETERRITKAIIDKYRIKHCILVSLTDYKISSFPDFKLLSTWDILANLKSPKELDYYINQYLYPMIGPGSMGTDKPTWIKLKKFEMPKTLIVLQNSTINNLMDLFYSYKNGQTAGYFTWIAFLEESQILTTADNIRIAFNVEFIAIHKVKYDAYKLMEVYRVSEVQFISNFGTWDSKNGLLTSGLNFLERRINLNKTILYAAEYSRIYDKTLYSYHKEVLEDFFKLINARIEKIDEGLLTISDILFTMHALTYVKYATGPILKIKYYAYIKEPKFSVSSKYFVLPFHKHLWLNFLHTLALTSFLSIFFYIRLRDQLKEEKTALIDYVFKTFEMYCNQSGSADSKNFSIRTLIFTIRLLVVIMFSAYSGTLLAYLLIRIPHPPFESLEELVEKTSFSVGCTFQGIEHFLFNWSINPFYQKIYSSFIENKVTPNATVEFNRVCTENHAHIGRESIDNTYKVDCKIFQIQYPVVTTLTSIRFYEHSGGISSLFSYKLPAFHSSGIINRMQRRLKGLKKMNSTKSFLSVEADHIVYVVSVLISGAILSLLIFLAELWKKK